MIENKIVPNIHIFQPMLLFVLLSRIFNLNNYNFKQVDKHEVLNAIPIHIYIYIYYIYIMFFELSVASISILIIYLYRENADDGEQMEEGRRFGNENDQIITNDK